MSDKIVLHLGDADSYSGQAARVLAEDFVARPCNSVDAIEAALRDGSARHAVVPLRNSLIGAIEGAERWEGGWVRTRDALSLPVDHCLAGLGTIEQVRRVTSHPAALAQCSKLLAKHGVDLAVAPIQLGENAEARRAAQRALSLDAGQPTARQVLDALR